MRISLCSRDALTCDALQSLLSHEGKFDVVATAAAPRACLTASKERQAQVIVLDAPGLHANDIEFFMGARAYGDFGIVLVGADPGFSASDHNIDALVDKDAGSGPFFQTIRDVGSQFLSVPTGQVREKRRKYGSGVELTHREFEVASLVSKGFSNRRIADVTGLREQSIKNLVSVIMRKLKCENRVQVAIRLTNATIAGESARS
jgi:DNA-binding NarL/FixJ family response regulator